MEDCTITRPLRLRAASAPIHQLCIILSVNSLAAAGWMVCWATDLALRAKSVAQQAAQIGS
jgi:hypothetical protein